MFEPPPVLLDGWTDHTNLDVSETVHGWRVNKKVIDLLFPLAFDGLTQFLQKVVAAALTCCVRLTCLCRLRVFCIHTVTGNGYICIDLHIVSSNKQEK